MWRAPRLMNSVRSRALNRDASSPRVPPIHSTQRGSSVPGFPLLFHTSRLFTSAVLYQQMFAHWSQFPAFICTGASTLLQRRLRGRRSVRTISLSLSPRTSGACACVYGGLVSWRNKRRVFIYHTCDAPLFLSNRDALMAKVQEEDMCW